MNMTSTTVQEQRATRPQDVFGKHYLPGEFLPFYVPRPLMPQVDPKLYPQIVVSLINAGGRVSFEVVNPRSLRAHQRVSHKLAKSMNAAVKRVTILVSADDFILDGNHRWWSNIHDGEVAINIMRLDMPFSVAIEWLKQQPGVYEVAVKGQEEHNETIVP
jgi:hypothetical protein